MHQHHSLDIVHNGTRIASNQLGYLRLHREDPRFQAGFVMDV